MALKILVVDDDKRLRSLLKSLLSEEKHEVTTCQSGSEAMERCHRERFDLVITDLMMPGPSGIEVLKEIRRTDPDTLVIIIMGFASLETAVQAIREGAYDYITKPFKLEQISILVNNARERIRLIQENRRLFRELQEAYEHLRVVRKIMGLEVAGDVKEQAPGPEEKAPLIAGSMLPYYYSNAKPGANGDFLSDLERLSVLREKAFLSEEEFKICKARLFKNQTH
jgi:DNA-binding response OmpR family regulator